jgi:hypothetical protein
MIATNPYYPATTWFSPTSTCRCTWTVCQCWTRSTNYLQTQWISHYHYKAEPLSKAVANKQQMDSLRLRAFRYVPERVRLPMPSVRPSVQALSMRIR